MTYIRTLSYALIILGIIGVIFSAYSMSKMEISDIPSQTISPLMIAKINQLQSEGRGDEKIPVVIVLKGKPSTMEAFSIQSLVQEDIKLLDADVYSSTSYALNTISAMVPANNISKLAEKDFVLAVYPDVEFQLLDTSLERISTENSWAMKMLNVTGIEYDGSGVTVVILDSGIQNSHPAISGKVVKEYDVEPGDYSHLHGTFVAGIVLSVAPNVSLVDVHVFDDSGSATMSEILKGLDYISQIAKTTNGPLVASFSWGTPPSVLAFSRSNPDPISLAVSNLIDQGVIVVAAAGNSDSTREYGDNIYVPSLVPAVISVGAVDRFGMPAYFSSTGPGADGIKKPDVSAPGVDIFSSKPGGYTTGSGTSYATPFISGIVSLMLQSNPSLDQYDVRDILIKTAGNTWDEKLGYGVPDCWKAVKMAEGWTVLSDASSKPYEMYLVLSGVMLLAGVVLYTRTEE